jgi:hypothetical protein
MWELVHPSDWEQVCYQTRKRIGRVVAFGCLVGLDMCKLLQAFGPSTPHLEVWLLIRFCIEARTAEMMRNLPLSGGVFFYSPTYIICTRTSPGPRYFNAIVGSFLSELKLLYGCLYLLLLLPSSIFLGLGGIMCEQMLLVVRPEQLQLIRVYPGSSSGAQHGSAILCS